MKHNRLHLESFESEEERAEQVIMTPAEAEEARLAAFEQGYAAGWEDACSTREAEEAKMRAAIGQALQDMSFTYHEARHHLLDSLSPLIVAMTTKILPEAARTALPRIVEEQLRAAAQTMSDVPVTVTANPSSISAIHDMIGNKADLPLVFAPDPSLPEGQVYLKFATSETRIDLNEVITKIGSSIDSYLSSKSEEIQNG